MKRGEFCRLVCGLDRGRRESIFSMLGSCGRNWRSHRLFAQKGLILILRRSRRNRRLVPEASVEIWLQAATSPGPRRKDRTAPSLELQPFHLGKWEIIKSLEKIDRNEGTSNPSTTIFKVGALEAATTGERPDEPNNFCFAGREKCRAAKSRDPGGRVRRDAKPDRATGSRDEGRRAVRLNDV